jgi:hypothetical protein
LAFLQFHTLKKKKLMATPKQPKFGEKYSHVMADLYIKFEPNRSRQNLARFGLGLRNAISHADSKKKGCSK